MKATVIDTVLQEFGTGTAYVNVRAQIDGDDEQVIFVPITISDARAGWARRELSVLGFDCDTRSILELDHDARTGDASRVLTGVHFEVDRTEEEYQGKMQTKYSIVTQTSVAPERIGKLDSILRGAKKAGTPARPTQAVQKPLPGPKPLSQPAQTSVPNGIL